MQQKATPVERFIELQTFNTIRDKHTNENEQPLLPADSLQ